VGELHFLAEYLCEGTFAGARRPEKYQIAFADHDEPPDVYFRFAIFDFRF